MKMYEYMSTLSGEDQNKSGGYAAEVLKGKNCPLRACLGNNYQKKIADLCENLKEGVLSKLSYQLKFDSF